MIAAILETILITASILMLFSTLALAIQSLGVLLKQEPAPPQAGCRPSIAILVPAHDEAEGIAGTVHHLRHGLAPGDRLLVVADNCADRTAALARASGAEVLVRNENDLRGKGYALAAGLAHLGSAAAEVFVFVDADCRFEADGLAQLAQATALWGTPVQCRNLMTAGADDAGTTRISEFAWRLRNDFRPSGYARLGLPCQLFGTGLAMPSRLIRPGLFATGHVTEDLLIGLECAIAGDAPRYLRDVTLISHFPETANGRDQQKRRWVHGHLAVILTHAPRLAVLAINRRSLPLLALAADVMVPPLTLLAAAHAGLFAAGAAFWLILGEWLPLAVTSIGMALFCFSLAVAWHFCGRDLIGRHEVLQLPRHMVRVLGTVKAFALGRRSAWVRAERRRLR
jgi:cellulose synthase/poly-beta-1,6-N-acetylglucosamine synthase-like glycosyltransferase